MSRKKSYDYSRQPAVDAVLTMMRYRRGATVAEMADARGVEEHTVRATLSRIRNVAGIELDKRREERGIVFRAPKGR